MVHENSRAGNCNMKQNRRGNELKIKDLEHKLVHLESRMGKVPLAAVSAGLSSKYDGKDQQVSQ